MQQESTDIAWTWEAFRKILAKMTVSRGVSPRKRTTLTICLPRELFPEKRFSGLRAVLFVQGRRSGFTSIIQGEISYVTRTEEAVALTFAPNVPTEDIAESSKAAWNAIARSRAHARLLPVQFSRKQKGSSNVRALLLFPRESREGRPIKLTNEAFCSC